jgi:putative DNA primase/helicase
MTATMDEASEHGSAQRLQGSDQNANTSILPPAHPIGNASHLMALPGLHRLVVPMHSEELEQAVLGGLLLDSGGLDHCGDLLTTDFFDDTHGQIFRAVVTMRNANELVDVISVHEHLKSQGFEVGGMEYLNALAQYVPSATNIRNHAGRLRELAARRTMAARIENLSIPMSDIPAHIFKLAEGVSPKSAQAFHALDVHALGEIQFKTREVILAPWLHSQDLCMVFAPRGIGKTHFGIAVAFAVATGGKFAQWSATGPRQVLYLDGELPGAMMQARLAMHCPDVEPAPGYLRVFTPDLVPDGRLMPDLATLAGQYQIDAMVLDADVVIVDNLSAWARSGRENEAESWLPIADWILALRRKGKAVILIHHSGKGGQQRGTSKKEDLLDVVIGLSRPKDYDPSQGAVFVSEFTKARNLTGKDAESLEMTMTVIDDRATWECRTVEASTYDRVVALTKEGLSPSEICAELDINKSTVSRSLRKAKDQGDLTKENK